MKRLIVTVAILVAGVVTAHAANSSAKTIDLYRRALGGAKAVQNIKSTTIYGSVKTPDGQIGTFRIESQAPDHLRIDIDGPARQEIQCYNGKSSWMKEPDGLRTLLGSEAEGLRLYALIVGTRLRRLSAYRVQASEGNAMSVDGRTLIPIDFSLGVAHITVFFDSATHLTAKIERNSTGHTETLVYDDYRKVDGIMEPFSIKISNGSSELSVTVDRVEHNKPLEASLFRYPQGSGEAPLPDVGIMLKTLEANQEKIEEVREHYTFHELQTERVYDGGGHLKETKLKEYEVTPVADTLVHRIIKENGKELSQGEQEKEDRRVQKEVEDIMKRREKREKQSEKKGAKDDSDEEITVLSFLKATEITSERRETLGGQQVIAFDFEPKKDFKPRNRTESLVGKLAGTMWVDQDANQIARLEAHFTGSFKVGGGLVASVSPSTAFVFEQKKIDGEVWLPSYAEANISAKILLLAKFNRGLTMQYSDYKKYHIDSDYNVKKPRTEEKTKEP